MPTPDGFKDHIGPDDSLYHKYDVQVPIGCADPKSVMQKMINHPTPGNPSPATPEGTVNNATVLGRDNIVTSYLTTDLNTGNPLVVNITNGNSRFSPGYVAREVSGGIAHTYGEGENYKQSPAFTDLILKSNPFTAPLSGQDLQDMANDALWGNQMRAMVQSCGCQKGQ